MSYLGFSMLVIKIGSVIGIVALSLHSRTRQHSGLWCPCHLAFDIADDRRSEQAQSWQTTELLPALYLIGRRIV